MISLVCLAVWTPWRSDIPQLASVRRAPHVQQTLEQRRTTAPMAGNEGIIYTMYLFLSLLYIALGKTFHCLVCIANLAYPIST